MKPIAFLVLVATIATDLAGQVRRADDLLTRAAAAIGGQAAIATLRNKVVEFNQVNFGLGQEETPESPARATFLTGRVVTDYAGLRQLTAQELRTVAGAVVRQRRVTLPAMSMLEANGALSMDPAAVSAGLERALSLQPERILLSALEHPGVATALRPRRLRGELADGVRVTLGPDTVNLWFDRPTGRPLALETLIDDDILGDRRTMTWYTRWQDAGGLALPRQIDVEVNGRLLSHQVITAAAVNQALEEPPFAIPDSMAARAPRSAPPGIAVTLADLGSGVWRAEGGSHHSLIVEQGTGLLVIEAPLSAARSAAVLDTLRRRFPGKRVTGVVLTHHHHDHSGGIRGYLTRGIPVIAHERNVAFVGAIGAARKTVAPDRLTRGAALPPVRPVRDSLTVGSGSGRVVLYRLPSVHAEGILAAWVPAAGVLFTSDVLSPAANQPPARAGSAELAALARAVGVTPRRFAGGHGVVVEWEAVAAAAR